MALKLSATNPFQVPADYWCIGELLWRKSGYKMVMMHLYASEEAAAAGAEPLDRVKVDISDAELELDAALKAAYERVVRPKIVVSETVRRDGQGNPVIDKGSGLPVMDSVEKQVNPFADAKSL